MSLSVSVTRVGLPVAVAEPRVADKVTVPPIQGCPPSLLDHDQLNDPVNVGKLAVGSLDWEGLGEKEVECSSDGDAEPAPTPREVVGEMLNEYDSEGVPWRPPPPMRSGSNSPDGVRRVDSDSDGVGGGVRVGEYQDLDGEAESVSDTLGRSSERLSLVDAVSLTV